MGVVEEEEEDQAEYCPAAGGEKTSTPVVEEGSFSRRGSEINQNIN